MTITLIGHCCLDVINHPDGSETQSYGGIFFSLSALANLLPASDVIYPVFGVGKGEYEALMERLKTYPNVDPSGIFKFNGLTNQVHLVYTNPETRSEVSRHIAESIPMKRIKPYLECDMVFINMISGFDITLETLDEIRMEVRDRRTPVYLDIHSVTLGLREDCSRYRRPLDTWRRWLFWLHSVQMNREEAENMSPEVLDRKTLAKHVLALNTHAMIVTLGSEGYEVYIDKHKGIQEIHAAGITVDAAVDATGCGDVFGAAYCAHYLRSNDVAASAAFANQAAAMKAGMAGSVDIDKLSVLRIATDSVGKTA